MKIVFLALSLFALSCASIPIPKSSQIQAAVSIGCGALDAAGCFDDASIQAALPGINMESCPERVYYLNDLSLAVKHGSPDVNTALVIMDKVDLSKFDPMALQRLRSANCKRAGDALGVK